MTAIIILVILLLIFFSGPIKKMTKGAGGAASAITKNLFVILLDAAAYGALLFVIYTGLPDFWKAWWSPPSFFWATNIAFFICVIGASLLYKRPYAFFGGLAVIWMVYSHCGQLVMQERKAKESGYYNSGSHTTTIVKSGLVQLPDAHTPCEIDVQGTVNDFYTDGEPIYVLPPGWSEDRAFRYSGKGNIKISGGNIRTGIWKFWSALDKDKSVLVRIFVIY